MSELTELFTNIADAIRTKEGSTDLIPAASFPTKISNLEAKSYKMEVGQKTASGGNFTLTFDSNIIMIIWAMGTTISSTNWRNATYYVEPTATFFTNEGITFDQNGLLSQPHSFVRESEYQSWTERIDERSVRFRGTQGTITSWALSYIAILEN